MIVLLDTNETFQTPPKCLDFVGDFIFSLLFLAFIFIYLLCFFDVLRFYATFILRAMSESRTVYRL